MKPWEMFYDPVNLAIYLLLSVYASGILLYESFKQKKRLTKWHIALRILAGFTPFYQGLVALVWTIFKPMEWWHNYRSEKESKEISNEDRENHVFGFLNYKGIDIQELDDYIESRKMIGKLVDKVK